MYTLVVAFATITEGYAEYKTYADAERAAVELAGELVTPTYTIVQNQEEPEVAHWRDAWERYIDAAATLPRATCPE